MSRINQDARRLQLQREADGDHLYANRIRVYPKSVHGLVRNTKWAILILCLTIYYVLPWIRWHRGPGQPTQAVLLDLSNERFYFFDLELWPQDIWLLAGLLVMGAVALFLVTSLFGRLWCGYTCPQTVWTDLFMLVERWIEGDRNERMQRDAEPLTADGRRRKLLKHAVWLGIAFWTGGAWIMYYVDAPTVTAEFWTGQASTPVYFFTGLFTLTTYLLAGWAREQVCTYMCPWPRFQSAMLDDQSFTVTYQSWRGEPRKRGKRTQETPPAGDCVDCGACVTVCPTGIDIRDGIQLECINCGLCIDACNHVMDVTHRDKWLITWDTLSAQAAKQAGRHDQVRIFRPRTVVYSLVLLTAIVALTTALILRPRLVLSVQRDRAPVFVPLPDGSIRNGYTVKIANKTQRQSTFDLTVDGLPGATLVEADAGGQPAPVLRLPGATDQIATFRVLVIGHPDGHADGTQPIDFVLQETTGGDHTVYHSSFMGPRGQRGGK